MRCVLLCLAGCVCKWVGGGGGEAGGNPGEGGGENTRKQLRIRFRGALTGEDRLGRARAGEGKQRLAGPGVWNAKCSNAPRSTNPTPPPRHAPSKHPGEGQLPRQEAGRKGKAAPLQEPQHALVSKDSASISDAVAQQRGGGVGGGDR